MKSSSGLIAITTVLIISVVALLIGITVARLSIGEGQTGLSVFQGEKELILAESCMEQAMWSIRESASYTGGAVTLPTGSCTIAISKTGNVWTVTSTTNSTLYKRSIQAIVTRASSLVLTSWREI